MTNGLPVRPLIPPMLGLLQCEKAANAFSGSAFASPPSDGVASTLTTPTAPASSRPSAKFAMLTP